MKQTKTTDTPNKAGLAKQLGITRQLLAFHLKDPSAPALGDLPGWKAFLSTKVREGGIPLDLRKAIAKERLRKLKGEADAVEHANRERANELMPTLEAVRQASEAWAYVFSKLETWQRELPPALAGGTAVDIGKRLHAETEIFRRECKQRFEKVGDQQ